MRTVQEHVERLTPLLVHGLHFAHGDHDVFPSAYVSRTLERYGLIQYRGPLRTGTRSHAPIATGRAWRLTPLGQEVYNSLTSRTLLPPNPDAPGA